MTMEGRRGEKEEDEVSGEEKRRERVDDDEV